MMLAFLERGTESTTWWWEKQKLILCELCDSSVQWCHPLQIYTHTLASTESCGQHKYSANRHSLSLQLSWFLEWSPLCRLSLNQSLTISLCMLFWAVVVNCKQIYWTFSVWKYVLASLSSSAPPHHRTSAADPQMKARMFCTLWYFASIECRRRCVVLRYISRQPSVVNE